MAVPRSLLLLVTLIFGVPGLSFGALAQDEDAVTLDDLDADGVPNQQDACLWTPAGDLVRGDGCSPCPCEERADGSPWSSRSSYVSCVATEARAQYRAGILTRKELHVALRHATDSSCARPELTRCCVYTDMADEVGSCRIITPDSCDAIDERMMDGVADDEDPGSCVPNPCVF